MSDRRPPEGAIVEGSARLDLALVDLTVDRGGRPVVHEACLDVPSGEITALLGPNGAGKSSIAAAIAGLARVRTGSVALTSAQGSAPNTGPITGWRPERVRHAGVSVVPEGRRLLSDLTVSDNLRVAAYSLDGTSAAEGIDYALSLFPELDRRRDSLGRLLSGGEQQMVVLAQALVSRPKVLVVDELSLGLAPIVVKRLTPVLAEVAHSGVAVLLIEQFAHVALELAARAYVLESGRIRYHGSAQELISRPDVLHSAYLLQD
ncbi:ABC transporter ATP-binding protein [Candidatus Poriferisodalis sp.]|uniref:ABC transporter ATP-binding protein n=1 Tax=Candidatus Poriferisodalis sp. TaxID=3101277 RepID=UPI003B01C37F